MSKTFDNYVPGRCPHLPNKIVRCTGQLTYFYYSFAKDRIIVFGSLDMASL